MGFLKPFALFAALTVGCYSPEPEDGAFMCSLEEGQLCPEGLRCDTAVTTFDPAAACMAR